MKGQINAAGRPELIGRRDLIAMLGGAGVAWAWAARGQSAAMPVIGFLYGGLSAPGVGLPELRTGLLESGFVEGQNVGIEYRISEGRYERLPLLAAELVGRKANVIVAGAPPASLAAKAATSTIPVVFAIGGDPVKLGLVASFNRPGGNVTGATFLNNELTAKQLELLHEIIPNAAAVSFLVNPDNPTEVAETGNAQAAAKTLGLTLHVVEARTVSELETAFAEIVQMRTRALVVASDAIFNGAADQIVGLAKRNAIPGVFPTRGYVAAGGLATYGANIGDAYYQAGLYVGRILKGAKPADLPVVQSRKLELVINLKTANTLGLTIPLVLLATADEVIE